MALLDGEPWFAAADVCRALFSDYNEAAGAHHYTQRLRADEKRAAYRRDPRTNGFFKDTSGGGRLLLISESGMYKLVMRSNKPEAAEFQDWVTREVLPAIRKSGGYRLCGTDPAAVTMGDNTTMHLPRDFAAALRMLADQVEANRELSSKNAELKPNNDKAGTNRRPLDPLAEFQDRGRRFALEQFSTRNRRIDAPAQQACPYRGTPDRDCRRRRFPEGRYALPTLPCGALPPPDGVPFAGGERTGPREAVDRVDRGQSAL
ncbi:MAG: hypothetical protein Tsb008_18360 [Rhodothalassiaceae bacterium]